jgi:biopolymer transport protein ExbD
MKIRHTRESEKIELQMTPMIDIVFQLLIFFIMTFKIVALEGDFNVKMPIAAPDATITEIDPLPPMKLRLRAGADGQIASIVLAEQAFDSFDGPGNNLHSYIMGLVGGDAGPGTGLPSAEIELDCDYHLNYEHVIQAITAVSGHITENGDIVKLIERIKFSSPKQPE